MPCPNKNANLGKARREKNDEFYTQRTDIEAELGHYDRHFHNKVVYCNCDDPRVSEFYLYFRRKYSLLGLRKLIAATYRNPDPDTRRPQSDLLLEARERYASSKNRLPAICIEYCGQKTGRPRHMKSDGIYHGGDFRSAESIALLKQADIVVTNPPFSLFREYVAQLVEYGKKFVIIGPFNAISYKEIFKLIQANQLWLGYGFSRGNAFFGVKNSDGFAKGVYDEKTGLVKFRNVIWFTNLDIDKRHENLLVAKRYYTNEAEYPKYDNYDAIEVGKVKLIPEDYPGVMGVPITFLQDYNPDQFEILGDSRWHDGNWSADDINIINGKLLYRRILIRHKHPAT